VKLPRWTAYAALALIFAMAIVAFPHRSVEPDYAALAGAAATKYPRVVVLGIDGLDPEILADVMERYPERMQHFRALADEGGIHSLGTSTPPQSPVAWSNFITGMNPGGHGIYDFIHRNPVTRGPAPSTSTEGHQDQIPLWGGWQLPLDAAGESNRSGDAFWTILKRKGVPADVWRMPANFPVEGSKGLAFSGMMTPAIDSAYGECTFYTTDPPIEAVGDDKVVAVSIYGDQIDTRITGPENAMKKGRPNASVPMSIFIDREADAVAIEAGHEAVVMKPGQWSEFLHLTFDMVPGGMMPIGGTVRFYLRSIEPEFELYASPVNIDPSHPVAPVAEPSSASAELADAVRGGIGPYYTQGMPEDVNALKRKVLDDAEFMDQADLVHREGEEMMDWAIDRYLEDPEGGLLFFYFSTIDLCCHMMWRHGDLEHPDHDPVFAAESSEEWSHRPGSTWQDVIDDLYLRMDPVLGHLRERIGSDTTLVVMSDHGFAPYARKFNLNTWLVQEGYLVLDEKCRVLPEDDPEYQDLFLMSMFDADPRKPSEEDPHVDKRWVVDWSKTRAYGMGFNSLYLNLAGREKDNPDTPMDESGIVRPGSEAQALLAEIKGKLESIRDEDGTQVVVRADLASEVYEGGRREEAPDMVVGYNYGYGNSDEASTGQITYGILRDNDEGGTFNGSHLMVPDVVRGVLMTNRRVLPGEHALEDLTVEVLKQYGIKPGPGMQGHPVLE